MGCICMVDHGTSTEDHGLLSDQYPNHWAIIPNCGYQGVQIDAHVIFSIMQPSSTNLTVSENRFFIDLSRNCVLVENSLFA